MKGANVGDESEFDLLDDEIGIGRAMPHISGSYEINAAANTRAVNRCDDWLTTSLKTGDDVLQIHYGATKLLSLACVAATRSLRDLRKHREINACIEVLAGAAQNDNAGLWHVIKFAKNISDIISHLPIHRVGLVWSVQHDVDDAVSQRHGQRFVDH